MDSVGIRKVGGINGGKTRKLLLPQRGKILWQTEASVRNHLGRRTVLKKLILFIAISLGSWLGWEMGVSYGIMTAYWMSLVGSLVGVVAGVLFNGRFMP